MKVSASTGDLYRCHLHAFDDLWMWSCILPSRDVWFPIFLPILESATDPSQNAAIRNVDKVSFCEIEQRFWTPCNHFWSAVILTILKNGQKQLYQWPFLNSDFPISTLWGINVWVPTKNITGLQWYWWFWNSMKTHHPSDHVEVWFFQFSAVWKITNVQCSWFSKVSISENKYVKVLHLLLLELVILWLPCLTPWSALSPMSKFVYTRSKQ